MLKDELAELHRKCLAWREWDDTWAAFDDFLHVMGSRGFGLPRLAHIDMVRQFDPMPPEA